MGGCNSRRLVSHNARYCWTVAVSGAEDYYTMRGHKLTFVLLGATATFGGPNTD